MFIAMNRFRVLKEQAHAFEQMWLTRDSRLHELKGFIEFQMLRGPEGEDGTVLYSSYTRWAHKADFEAWTKSEQFRVAHERAENRPRMTTGHPQFEGFEVIQYTNAEGAPGQAA
ncbi:MAG TPA: antibiotic biosynthesis monooxygenase [Rhodoblastus sp.]|nr:antibiotic biosynthesis monooxygenase [Rhodoblastus sp.]